MKVYIARMQKINRRLESKPVNRLKTRKGLLLALAATLAAAAPLTAEPPPPGLVVEAVRVAAAGSAGERPGAATLCTLTVQVRNTGTEKASALAFRVELNGQELPVYRNHVFYHRLDPGQSTELRLYNFWTTETARPFPADGKLRVSAALIEAQWMRIETEAGVEIWTPIRSVAGLPSAQTITVDLAGGKG